MRREKSIGAEVKKSGIRDACRVTGCELTLKVCFWIWTQKQKGMHHSVKCWCSSSTLILILIILMTPPFFHLQAPLCLPITQNNSKNRHNYSLISWPVMQRAWWNILYPLIFPQGGAGDRERWLNAPITGHSSLIESQMFQQATSPNDQFSASLPLSKHCHFHKPPKSLQFLFWSVLELLTFDRCLCFQHRENLIYNCCHRKQSCMRSWDESKIYSLN